jgi:hypothetical protein
MKKILCIFLILAMLPSWLFAASRVSRSSVTPYPRIVIPKVVPAEFEGYTTNLLTNTVGVVSYSNQTFSLTNVIDTTTNVYTVITNTVPITNNVDVVSTNVFATTNSAAGKVYCDFVLIAYNGTNCVYAFESKEGISIE